MANREEYPVTAYGSAVCERLRENMAEWSQKKPDKSWAPRLLARVAKGEKISPYCVALAKEVVAMRERTPGEDDE